MGNNPICLIRKIGSKWVAVRALAAEIYWYAEDYPDEKIGKVSIGRFEVGHHVYGEYAVSFASRAEAESFAKAGAPGLGQDIYFTVLIDDSKKTVTIFDRTSVTFGFDEPMRSVVEWFKLQQGGKHT